MGEYDKALADFDRAIDLDPQDAGAIARRGMTYHMMGGDGQALADVDRAHPLAPPHAVTIAPPRPRHTHPRLLL